MTEKEKLIQEVRKLYKKVKILFANDEANTWKKPENEKIWETLVEKAFELSKIVKPKHHKYMMAARGCFPDNPKFYDCIGSIKELLDYIRNPHKFNDPVDLTLGDSFELIIYSRSRGYHNYTIKRNKNGWKIVYLRTGDQCNKRGKPYLYEILDIDLINYPEALPDYIERVWNQAEEKGLTHEQVQKALNKLAEWINICESKTPKLSIWKALK